MTSLGCEMSPRVTATLCRKGNVNSQESRRQLCEGSCTAGVEEAAMGWVTRVASPTYIISFLCSTGDSGPSSGRCLPDIRISLSTRDLKVGGNLLENIARGASQGREPERSGGSGVWGRGAARRQTDKGCRRCGRECLCCQARVSLSQPHIHTVCCHSPQPPTPTPPIAAICHHLAPLSPPPFSSGRKCKCAPRVARLCKRCELF